MMATPGRTPPDRGEGEPVRVLLIEDDPDDADLIAGQLGAGARPVQIDHASDMAGAARRLGSDRFDVILLDLGLPDAQGVDTYTRLTEVDAAGHPVVVLSAAIGGEVPAAGIQRGAQDYIDKAECQSGLLWRVLTHAIERADAEDLRRAHSELFEALIANSLDSVWVIDADDSIMYAGGNDDRGGRDGTWVHFRDRLHPDDVASWQASLRGLVTAGHAATDELKVRLRGPGGYDWVEVRLVNLLSHRAVRGVVVNGRDITERHRLETRLQHQATHDQLTGLPNRALAFDRIDRALSRAARRGGAVWVVFLDLDEFKMVNDMYGHHVGDQLLIAVAERLRSVMRESDTLARLGGDEFVAVLEAEDAARVVERMEATFHEPICMGDQQFKTTASFGLAVATDGDRDAANLLADADLAMYRAKDLGGNRMEAFDRSLRDQFKSYQQTSAELAEAIDNGELRVHYQPIVCLASGRVQAVEALVRWQHPVRGLLRPDSFIEVAEAAGLIDGLDRFVLAEACRQARGGKGDLRGDLEVNVNISARSLIDPRLAADVRDVLSSTGVAATRLNLEITETALMQHPARAEATLTELDHLGVNIILDDFGTGFSSLTHLRQLPINGIKIDRSFTGGLGEDPQDTTIVRSLINLAQDLDVRVTAEGVETERQLALLRELRCHYAQGFLLGRPEARPDLESGLARRSIDVPRE